MARRYQLITFAACLAATFSFSNKAIAEVEGTKTQAHFDLILAGGGLATCSSFATKNCVSENFSDQDLRQLLFKFSSQRRENFHQSHFYQTLSSGQKLNIDAIVDYLYSKKGEQYLTKREVSKTLNASRFKDEYQALPDALYYALFDYFEVQQKGLDGQRKTERVVLSDSKNTGTQRVYQAFIDSATQIAKNKMKETTNVVVITASSRDPFESADFYQGVFSAPGIDVLWLPLDMSLQKAIEQQTCSQLESIRNQHLSFNRENLYPERTAFQSHLCRNPSQLVSYIKEADGVFFNGGDQSRTIAALTKANGEASATLRTIREQNDNHQLVVGGTSAGTAVQAGGKFGDRQVVMLSNGDPKFALQRGAHASTPPSARCDQMGQCPESNLQPGDLTYRALGGSGLFTLGLLDTHFSERDREVRLAVFAHQTQNRFAFGVDEATALAVSKRDNGDYFMTVIGENGVFITLTQNHPSQLHEDTSARFVSGIAHFLNEHDSVNYLSNLQSLEFEFAKSSEILKRPKKAKNSSKKAGKWRAKTSRQCGDKQAISWQQFGHRFMLKAANKTAHALNNKNQCSYTHLPFVISQ